MFRRILGSQLSAAKGTDAYDVDPAISERLAFQILRMTLPKVARGSIVRARLAGSAGVMLVGKGVRVTHPQLIICGRGFVVEDGAELHGLSSHGLRFGDNVTVGRDAQVRPSGYYGRSLGWGLRVGNNSNLGPGCYIGASGGIVIGDNVLMGPGVTVLSEEHDFTRRERDIRAQGVTEMKTVINDDVWLGARSVILGGSHVGKGSVIAAGAVVKGSVPPYAIMAGVPARVVRERGE